MYLDHFKLQRQPFPLTPDTDLFHGGAGREAILEALRQAVVAGEGIIKVTGATGSGKTMLCRTLCRRLAATVDVAMLLNPNMPPEQVVAAILREFRVAPGPSGDRWADQHLLLNHLVELHRRGRNALVLVEEAQSMPPASLEELRLLSNFETSRTKLFQIVLFGQPELDRVLALPVNQQLAERISTSLHLLPLTQRDTALYVRDHLLAAGHPDGEIFSKWTLWLLHRMAHGDIRRTNILAHKALVAAFADLSEGVRLRHLRTALASSDWSLALGSFWQRPALVAGALAVLLVGGTALHSWGPVGRMMVKNTLNADWPAERGAEKGITVAALPSPVKGGVVDGPAVGAIEGKGNGQEGVKPPEPAPPAAPKGSEPKESGARGSDNATVGAKKEEGKGEAKVKGGADKNSVAIAAKGVKGPEKRVDREERPAAKVAEKPADKTTPPPVVTAEVRDKKDELIAAEKGSGKGETRVAPAAELAGKGTKSRIRTPTNVVELPTADEILVATVASQDRAAPAPTGSPTPGAPGSATGTDRATGTGKSTNPIAVAAGSALVSAAKGVTASAAAGKPSFEEEMVADSEWQPDPKQNYPYLKK
ncbi:MAG: AAA family ATPase, partial [Magnetococcales bacterium]|nr:AAA family ATPase [Magnetococcales bacterium]